MTMTRTSWRIGRKVLVACSFLSILVSQSVSVADPPATPASPPAASTPAASPQAAAETPAAIEAKDRVPVAVARDRAKLLHDVYVSTMDVIHQRYFHGERAVIPARAMEDIFSDIKRQYKMDARWISVSFPAMGINHEPQTEFEKNAASEIAAGKNDVEQIEGGIYRRAGSIQFSEGCIHCHGGFFRTPSKKPKYVGLVIAMPITEEK